MIAGRKGRRERDRQLNGFRAQWIEDVGKQLRPGTSAVFLAVAPQLHFRHFNAVNRSDIARALQVSTRAVIYQITQLVLQGYVQEDGSDRGASLRLVLPPPDLRPMQTRWFNRDGSEAIVPSTVPRFAQLEAVVRQRAGKSTTTWVSPHADDVAAFNAWLTSKKFTEGTHKAYLREGGRFMMWAGLVCKKSLRELTQADCAAFRDFLKAIPEDWISKDINRQMLRAAGLGWSPFMGQMGARTLAQVISIIAIFCKWLANEGRHIPIDVWATSESLFPESTVRRVKHVKVIPFAERKGPAKSPELDAALEVLRLNGYHWSFGGRRGRPPLPASARPKSPNKSGHMAKAAA